jgi:hypothetical protein
MEKLMRIFFSLQDKELIFCFGEVDVRLHINYKLAFLEYEVFYLSIQNFTFYELVIYRQGEKEEKIEESVGS